MLLCKGCQGVFLSWANILLFVGMCKCGLCSLIVPVWYRGVSLRMQTMGQMLMITNYI